MRRRVSSTTSFSVAFQACLAVSGFIALGFFLWRTKFTVALTLASAIAAVALDHAVEALTRRGLRRWVAIAAVIVAGAAVVAGLGRLLIPPAVEQGKALLAEAPALWRRLHEVPLVSGLVDQTHLEQLLPAPGAAAGAVSPVLSAIGGVVSAAGGLVGFLFLTVFMLVFGRDLVRAALAEVSPARRERYARITSNLYSAVGGYLGGLLGICAINATLTTIFLVIIRMPFFLPLGILSGFSSLVPYAGPLVAGASITIVALVTGGLWKAAATAIYFVLYGQLEGNVLAPLIFRRTAHVNPLVTLLAVLFLAEFAGVFGAVIAVPAAAAAQVVASELLSWRRERLAAQAAAAARDGAGARTEVERGVEAGRPGLGDATRSP
jgi:predicted PurR-regulated permease PerM